MKKNYFSLVLVTLACLFTLASCKKNNDSGPTEASLLTSKQWTIKTVTDETNSNADVTSSFSGKKVQFNSDGSYTHDLNTTTETGTYVFGGGTISMTSSSGTAYAATLSSVTVTSTQLDFKMTISSTKVGPVTYAVVME